MEKVPEPAHARIGEELPDARWEYTISILHKIFFYANARSRNASFGMRPCAGPSLLPPTYRQVGPRLRCAGRRAAVAADRHTNEQTFMPSDSSRVLVFVPRAVVLHAIMFAAVRRSRLSAPHLHKPRGSGPSAAEPRPQFLVTLATRRLVLQLELLRAGPHPRAWPRRLGPPALPWCRGPATVAEKRVLCGGAGQRGSTLPIITRVPID
jgi:hypothetical protein